MDLIKSGGTRDVYVLDEERVLKAAKNDEGLWANRLEWEFSSRLTGIVVPVLECSEEGIIQSRGIDIKPFKTRKTLYTNGSPSLVNVGLTSAELALLDAEAHALLRIENYLNTSDGARLCDYGGVLNQDPPAELVTPEWFNRPTALLLLEHKTKVESVLRKIEIKKRLEGDWL